MSAAPNAVREEGPGHPSAGRDAIALREQGASEALLNRSGFDIANLSEDQFEQGLAKIKLRQERMVRVIAELLRDGIHYGNPVVIDRKTGEPVMVGGKPKLAFDKPILLNPGASELRNFFRVECHQRAEPQILAFSKDLVSVLVEIGAYDSVGRLLGTAVGACTSAEPRFRFGDPREKINDIIKQAFKRAANQVTAQVTGADAFFVSEAELERVVDEGEEEQKAEAGPPWTEEEKTQVYGRAHAKGIRKSRQFAELVDRVLGREYIATGEDVKKLLAEIERLPDLKDVEPEVVSAGRTTPPQGTRAPTPQKDGNDELPF